MSVSKYSGTSVLKINLVWKAVWEAISSNTESHPRDTWQMDQTRASVKKGCWVQNHSFIQQLRHFLP